MKTILESLGILEWMMLQLILFLILYLYNSMIAAYIAVVLFLISISIFIIAIIAEKLDPVKKKNPFNKAILSIIFTQLIFLIIYLLFS